MGDSPRKVISRPVATLVALLVASGAFAGWLGYMEVRSGGVASEWHHEADSGAYWILPRFIDTDGSVVAEESGNPNSYVLSFSPAGKLEWRFSEHGVGYPEQGPDGRIYLVNQALMSNGSTGGQRNLTSLDNAGNFKWDYIAENGTLEIWGIYSDGEVIVHDYMHDLRYPYNETLSRIAAVKGGAQLWSMSMPLLNSSWSDARIAENGTFVVNAYDNVKHVRYEVGISKDGSLVYAKPGVTYLIPLPSEGHNETLLFEERRYYLNNDTSEVGAYGIRLSDRGIAWKTELFQSDNPSHILAGVYESKISIMDSSGDRVYFGLIGGRSYALTTDGQILWERPDFGWMVAAYPSGGVLAWDNVSLKLIGPDGDQIWRHYTSDIGSFVILGSDKSIYYSHEDSLIALKHTTGPSLYDGLIIAVIAADAAVVLLVLRPWRRQQTPST